MSAVVTKAAAAALAGAVATSGAALAQDQPAYPITVQIQAVGEDGVAGIALLSPTETGTSVQVQDIGAPAGTTAVIQAGSCPTPDAALVGLLGELGTGSPAQADVPVPIETLADGGHAIAFHPGLDMATTVGCGQIPAAAPDLPTPDQPAPDQPAPDQPAPDQPGPPAPTVAPIPTLAPLPTVAPAPPAPTLDPACAGVADWIASTEARIARITEALANLNAIAGRYDLTGYLNGLASLEGELLVMVADQAGGPVPAASAEANARAVAAYETFIEAARQIYESLTVSVDISTYSQAMGRYEQATQIVGEVQRGIGALKGRCAAPAA